MNNTIKIEINGQFIKKSSKNAGAAGSGNTQNLEIVFDESWLGFGKRIIWRNAKGENETSVILIPKAEGDNLIYETTIPPEATGEMGWCSFTIEGYYSTAPTKILKSVRDTLFVSESEGSTNLCEPTPSQTLQLQEEIEGIMPQISEKLISTKEEIGKLADSISVWEEYKDNSFYEKNNKVAYNGRCFVCIKECKGVSPENESYWLMIASKGDKGEKGEQGIQGIQGIQGVQGIQGIQGEKGDKGEQGDRGLNGTIAPTNGFYSFTVDESGDLWVHYPDEQNPPEVELNENGELILNLGENLSSYNVGAVQGPKGDKGERGEKGESGYTPIKGVDYFTQDEKNEMYDEAESRLYEEVESIDIIETHHYMPNGTMNLYSGWSIVFFPVVEGQHYEYSGLTKLGNSPHFAFENECGKIIEVFRQSAGTNRIIAPPNATRLGASIADEDLEAFQVKQIKYTSLEAQNIIKEDIAKINEALGDFSDILEQGTLTSEGEKGNDVRRVRFSEAITTPFYVKTNDEFIIRIVCLYDKETLDLVSYTTYTSKTEFISDGEYAVKLVFGKTDISAATNIYDNIIQSVSKSVVSLFDSQSEIALCNINELPKASKRRIAVVKPSLMTENYGPVWSDSYVWRWVNDNKLAISAKSYYTAKVSDGAEVISHNKTGVYESASITKLLAALTAEAYISDYSETVTVADFDNRGVGTSDTWVKPNDVITYNDLYHAVLIKSDNAAAKTLGRCVGYIINPDA